MKTLFKKLFTLACACGLGLPSIAGATVNAYRCNGCTETQYRSAATAPEQLGARYVYDFVNGNLRKYQVTREPNGHGFTYYTEQLTITTADQSYFDLAADAWNANGFTLKRTAQLPVTGAPGFPLPSNSSAYDIAPNSALRNDISDWLVHVGTPQGSDFPASFDQAVEYIVALVRLAPGGIVFPDDDTAQLTITFEFTTQHKVTFVWKKGTSPVMTDARDGNNNSVPLSPNDVNNHHFNFGGGDGHDATRFANYVNPWGFNVQNNSCGRTTIACASGGGVTECVAYPACP